MNAGFLLRFKAFLIDYILILGYGAVLLIFNVFLFPQVQNLFKESMWLAQFTGFVMVTLPVSIYFIVSDFVFHGQSFGKKKIGIRTIGENGARLSLGRAVFRVALKFLPWELSHFLAYRLAALGEMEVPIVYFFLGGIVYALIILYIATAIFTKKKQAFYDIIAKTQVVKVRPLIIEEDEMG